MNMSDISHYTVMILNALTLKDVIILYLILCCFGLMYLIYWLYKANKENIERAELWQAKYHLIKGVKNERF